LRNDWLIDLGNGLPKARAERDGFSVIERPEFCPSDDHFQSIEVVLPDSIMIRGSKIPPEKE
jgi:hypothetical protein